MSCRAADEGLSALDDTALATLFEQLPGLGMTRELVVVVPAVSRRWRNVCQCLVSACPSASEPWPMGATLDRG